MLALPVLSGLLALTSASPRLRRQAKDSPSCDSCRFEFRQCMALPYGSIIVQAETNTYINCAKEISLKLLGPGFNLNLPGKVDLLAWQKEGERSDCFHELINYGLDCQKCYKDLGGEDYGMDDSMRECSGQAEAAKEQTRQRKLRQYLTPRVRAKSMCDACAQSIVACEELNFEDHYRKYDADLFSECLNDRLGPKFKFEKLVGVEPRFLSPYLTTDFSDAPEAVREKYGNGDTVVGREYCVNLQVFAQHSLCAQCMAEKGEKGTEFLGAVKKCQKYDRHPDEQGGEVFDKEEMEGEKKRSEA